MNNITDCFLLPQLYGVDQLSTLSTIVTAPVTTCKRFQNDTKFKLPSYSASHTISTTVCGIVPLIVGDRSSDAI